MTKDTVTIDLKGGKNNATVINDLSKMLDGVGLSDGQAEVLLPKLLQYLVERDYSVWNHAYRLGKASATA